MSTYNMLHAVIKCPRCNTLAEMEILTYFGFRQFRDYKIGDKVEWTPRNIVKNGGRPENGTLDGEGYTECPLCAKDFFIRVKVDSDIIEGIEPDLSKNPYIPD
jgi:hypothetical protein